MRSLTYKKQLMQSKLLLFSVTGHNHLTNIQNQDIYGENTPGPHLNLNILMCRIEESLQTMSINYSGKTKLNNYSIRENIQIFSHFLWSSRTHLENKTKKASMLNLDTLTITGSKIKVKVKVRAEFYCCWPQIVEQSTFFLF